MMKSSVGRRVSRFSTAAAFKPNTAVYTSSSSVCRSNGWVNYAVSSRKRTEVPAIANKYLPQILTSQVYEAANETPLQYAHNISSLTENDVYLKREDTQPVHSFKIRGAYNNIAMLSDEQRKKGIVTCSAGNHAQGVALSASKLGIKAKILMPLATPKIKVNSVRRHGGPTVEVMLHGQNFDEAAAEARRLAIEEGLAMIHPFDDPLVIAGQGTVGMEILKILNARRLDAIFVCTGGGGLLAGVAAYVKAVRPEVKVIGVEADDAAGMTASLQAGRVVTLDGVGLFADGAAVKTVGNETFKLCSQLVDEMVTVSTDEICAAIKLGFNDTRCVLEPAGALGIAGLIKYAHHHGCVGRTFVAISSGANMDFDRLRFVSERADSSESMLAVTIPEVPGAFRVLQSLIHPRNITEFSYRHNGKDRANVVVSFQTLSRFASPEECKEELMDKLDEKGFEYTDLTDNDMAKTHLRHMAGGRSKYFEDEHSDPAIELLYRVNFPEHPGALDKFLATLQTHNKEWSISLFHYRNHGHDFGRVLLGMHIKDGDQEEFDRFLDDIGYEAHEETDNPAYQQFLR